MATPKANLSFIAARVAKRRAEDTINTRKAKKFVTGLSISSFNQDNFTIVVLSGPDGGVVGAGTSKKCPDDYMDDNVGYNIALTRAVESVFDGLSKIDASEDLDEENIQELKRALAF